MVKISKSIIVPAAVVLCLMLLVGRPVGPTAEAQAGQTGQINVCHQFEMFVGVFLIETDSI